MQNKDFIRYGKDILDEKQEDEWGESSFMAILRQEVDRRTGSFLPMMSTDPVDNDTSASLVSFSTDMPMSYAWPEPLTGNAKELLVPEMLKIRPSNTKKGTRITKIVNVILDYIMWKFFL